MCIQIVHDFLLKICKESDLQGLSYYGGPLVPCACPQQSGVLEVVSYEPDHVLKDKEDQTASICKIPVCPDCLSTDKRDRKVNKILSDQVCCILMYTYIRYF